MDIWQNEEAVSVWIIIAVLFAFFLISVIIILFRAIFKKMMDAKAAESKALLEYQKKLLQTSIEVQEKERKRIAEDLHDALIGKLALLQMETQVEYPNYKYGQQIRDCIDQARRISHDLSPPLLEFSSMSELLGDILESWRKVLNVNYTTNIISEVECAEVFKIQLMRIVQEMLVNVQKHANAKSVSVYYRQSTKGVALQFSDNGKGFDLKEHNRGLGLKNIESRVQYLQGVCRMNSVLNKGTSVLLLFDLNEMCYG